MKNFIENVWLWAVDHPMLTIWTVVTVQALLVNLLGGAE